MKKNLIFIKLIFSPQYIFIFIFIISFVSPKIKSFSQNNNSEIITSKLNQFNFTLSLLNKISNDLQNNKFEGVYEYFEDSREDKNYKNKLVTYNGGKENNKSKSEIEEDDHKGYLIYILIIAGSIASIIIIVLFVVICSFMIKNKDFKDKINRISFAEYDYEDNDEKKEEEILL